MIEEIDYTYKETNNYQGTIKEAGGYVFLHLEVKKMTPSVYKEMKLLFKEVCEHFADKGHELIFSTISSPKTLKMCYKIGSPYDVKEINDYGTKYWVVAWETGLEV